MVASPGQGQPAAGVQPSSTVVGKALSGVNWRKAAQGVADDGEFLKAVREMYGVLTPEAQGKVTGAMKSLRDGNGPVVTGTPVDGLLGRKLAKTLSGLATDPAAKDELATFEASGNLPGLIAAITGTGAPPTPVTEPVIPTPAPEKTAAPSPSKPMSAAELTEAAAENGRVISEMLKAKFEGDYTVRRRAELEGTEVIIYGVKELDLAKRMMKEISPLPLKRPVNIRMLQGALGSGEKEVMLKELLK